LESPTLEGTPEGGEEDGAPGKARAIVSAAVVDRVAGVLTAWPPPCIDTLCLAAWSFGDATLCLAEAREGLCGGLDSRRMNRLHATFTARVEEMHELARDSVWVDRLGTMFADDARALGRPVSFVKTVTTNAFERTLQGHVHPGVLWDPSADPSPSHSSVGGLRRAWAATRALAALNRARQSAMPGSTGSTAAAAAAAEAMVKPIEVKKPLTFTAGTRIPDPRLLDSAITCGISFVDGVEERVQLVWHDDSVVLAEPKGKVVAVASVLAAAARVDDAHPHWLHVTVRPSVDRLDAGTWARFTDGKWTLAFKSAEVAAKACDAIATLGAQRRSIYAEALDAGLGVLALAWDAASPNGQGSLD